MNPAELLTQSAAAREMGVTRQAVADRIAAGKLEVFEADGSTLVTRKGLTEWKDERRRRARKLLETSE